MTVAMDASGGQDLGVKGLAIDKIGHYLLGDGSENGRNIVQSINVNDKAGVAPRGGAKRKKGEKTTQDNVAESPAKSPKKRRAAQAAQPADGEDEAKADAADAHEEDIAPKATASQRLSGQASALDVDHDDPDEDDDSDEAAWRRGLEELRRRRDADIAAGEEAPQGLLPPRETAELVRAVVRTIEEGGSWSSVLGVAHHVPRAHAITAVVQQVSDAQLASLVSACARRHEAHPREREFASALIAQAISLRGHHFLKCEEARRAVELLMESVSERLGGAMQAGKVLACLGKWRLVQSLAAARRERQLEAQDSRAQDQHESLDESDPEAADCSDEE